MPLHKGPRNADGGDYFDDFDDVSDREGGGVFGGGLGRTEFESLKERVGPGGITVGMQCRRCGKDAAAEISWYELYVIGSNGPNIRPLLPEGWARSDNNMAAYPVLQHQGCGGPICPMFTPDEAREAIGRAVQAGYVTQDQLQQWREAVARYRGGG